jgi:hypothetical protein
MPKVMSSKLAPTTVLVETSHHGFVEGPPKMVVRVLLKKVVLAEAMLVKSPKLVVKPLMRWRRQCRCRLRRRMPKAREVT